MDKLPVEIFEQITSYLPDIDLFTVCQVSRVWYQISRHEAYKRWVEYAILIGKAYWLKEDNLKAIRQSKIDWGLYFTRECNINGQYRKYAHKQIYIMWRMTVNGMIVDPSEKVFIERSLIEYKWGILDIWKFDWVWEEDCYTSIYSLRY